MKHWMWTVSVILFTLHGCGGGSSTSNGVTLGIKDDFAKPINYPSPLNYIYLGDTAMGDLNGDGKNDVAAIQLSNITGLVLIYYQNSSGRLDNPIVKDTNVFIYGIAIADVNNDGKKDLILSGITKSPRVGSLGRVVVYLQNPVNGELQPAQEYEISTNSHVNNLIVADFNGDGKNDVAVMARQVGTNSYVAALFQNNLGTFNSEIKIGEGIIGYGSSFQVGDINSDGMVDIVSSVSGIGLVVFRQLTAGEFSITPETYAGPIENIVLGDLNGDGRIDVLSTEPGNTSIKIFHQKTNGTLEAPVKVNVPIYNPVYGMKISDITSDGLNDILLDVNDVSPDGIGWGGVAVYPQENDHTFINRHYYSYHSPTFGGWYYHNGLTVGDITNDGYNDVVMTWMDQGLYVFPHVGR